MKQQDFNTALGEAAEKYNSTLNYRGDIERMAFMAGGKWSRAWVLRNDPIILGLVEALRYYNWSQISKDAPSAKALAAYEKEIEGL